jgi:hypothetical protein
LYLPGRNRRAEPSPGTAQKPGAAQSGKISKAQAKYQDKPKGDQKCANCMHFIMAARGN